MHRPAHHITVRHRPVSNSPGKLAFCSAQPFRRHPPPTFFLLATFVHATKLDLELTSLPSFAPNTLLRIASRTHTIRNFSPSQQAKSSQDPHVNRLGLSHAQIRYITLVSPRRARSLATMSKRTSAGASNGGLDKDAALVNQPGTPTLCRRLPLPCQAQTGASFPRGYAYPLRTARR